MLQKIMGSGIVTSILGYGLIVMDVANQAMQGQMPQSPWEWGQFVVGIMVGVMLRIAPDPSFLKKMLGTEQPK